MILTHLKIVNERTSNACDPAYRRNSLFPIKEVDGAGEILAWFEPLWKWDSQPACDAVVCTIPVGRVIGGDAIFDVHPINLPGHIHMVRIEIRGHTQQGLLVFLVFFILTLLCWRFKHFHFWWLSCSIWCCGTKRIESLECKQSHYSHFEYPKIRKVTLVKKTLLRHFLLDFWIFWKNSRWLLGKKKVKWNK